MQLCTISTNVVNLGEIPGIYINDKPLINVKCAVLVKKIWKKYTF